MLRTMSQQAYGHEEEMIKRRVAVEEWGQPELQAFHLCSPPHSAANPEVHHQANQLVIELEERGGGGLVATADATSLAASLAVPVSSSSASGPEMEAANGNVKVEEQQPATVTSRQEDVKPAPAAAAPTVGFGQLFRFADELDCLLMAIGTAGAIVHGCSLPIFLRFFADLVNSFGSNAGDPDTMVREVVKVLSPPPRHPSLFLSF
ncbi:hypothetical protein BHE74_00013828 [Ensete ventricosum]|uniref:Uncharacterized protein n=1 Tax=Ensete ventricosum TaxID=4639 RepID=A0A427A3V9_ENSVE|nr:hypothetical protein B296_00016442 [Ensete ventricosum]RWW25820.1 hypothetical protein GW17_00009825 [Ensete ventricosum]RWW77972.1 hypothetical protein BHE74_00013828 [Ensete ventricosum]RZR92691.1 hypothetical protein BHM03_00021044 [Ensete ventricosum]